MFIPNTYIKMSLTLAKKICFSLPSFIFITKSCSYSIIWNKTKRIWIAGPPNRLFSIAAKRWRWERFMYRVGIWKFPPTLKRHNFWTDLNFGAIFFAKHSTEGFEQLLQKIYGKNWTKYASAVEAAWRPWSRLRVEILRNTS